MVASVATLMVMAVGMARRRANGVGERECWKDRTDGVEGSRFGGDLALVI